MDLQILSWHVIQSTLKNNYFRQQKDLLLSTQIHDFMFEKGLNRLYKIRKTLLITQ